MYVNHILHSRISGLGPSSVRHQERAVNILEHARSLHTSRGYPHQAHIHMVRAFTFVHFARLKPCEVALAARLFSEDGAAATAARARAGASGRRQLKPKGARAAAAARQPAGSADIWHEEHVARARLPPINLSAACRTPTSDELAQRRGGAWP